MKPGRTEATRSSRPLSVALSLYSRSWYTASMAMRRAPMPPAQLPRSSSATPLAPLHVRVACTVSAAPSAAASSSCSRSLCGDVREGQR
eukprot:354211-Chlamydomonas_euryale.AAC.2